MTTSVATSRALSAGDMPDFALEALEESIVLASSTLSEAISASASAIVASASDSRIHVSASSFFTPSTAATEPASTSAAEGIIPRSTIASAVVSKQDTSASGGVRSVTQKAVVVSTSSDSAAPSGTSSTDTSSIDASTATSSSARPSDAPEPAPAPSSSTPAASTVKALNPTSSKSSSVAVSTKSSVTDSTKVVSTQANQISTSSSSKASSSSAKTNDPVSSSTDEQRTDASSSVTSSHSSKSSLTAARLTGSEGSVITTASSSAADGVPGVSTSGQSSSIHATSTLLEAQAVTVTSGGSTIITTPSFITSISVSSALGGSVAETFTSIFANPTVVSSSSETRSSTFWDNKGAVAGVFIAVAILVIALAASLLFFCRRRSIRRMRANAQFRFSGPPNMSQQPTTYGAVRNYGATPFFVNDDPQRSLMAPSLRSGPSFGHEDPARASSNLHSEGSMQDGTYGLTGVLAVPSQVFQGPFGDYHRYIATGDTQLGIQRGESLGAAVINDYRSKVQPEHRSPSPVPSSPSIYPSSLPPVPEKDEDDYLFYQNSTQRRSDIYPTPPQTQVSLNKEEVRNPFADPRPASMPPQVSTQQAYRPITPPDSSPGHSPVGPEFSGTTRPLQPFSNAFLGRSVSLSTRTEPPRPPRSPLRRSITGAPFNQ